MLRTLASKTVSTTPNASMNIMSIVESGQDLNFGLGTKVNNQNASYIFFITKIINRTFIMYYVHIIYRFAFLYYVRMFWPFLTTQPSM